MNWWGWVLLAVYLAGAVLALPRIAYVLAHDVGYGSSLEGIDVFFGYFVAAIVVPVWPLAWIGYRWYLHAKDRDFAGMLVAPRPIRQKVEREQMQRRICDLERELEIR